MGGWVKVEIEYRGSGLPEIGKLKVCSIECGLPK